MSAAGEQGVSEPGSAPPTVRRLPTRVNNACRRCRRNKSRCDSFRPCSLCSRADVDCEPAQADEPPRGKSRDDRNPRHEGNPRKRPRSRGSSAGRADAEQQQPARRPFSPSEHDEVENIERRPGGAHIPVPIDRRRSWIPVAYGESESALGIARKICGLGGNSIDDHPTSAIPGGGGGNSIARRRTGDKRLPISTILGGQFPDQQLIHSLLEDYFASVHFFSLVIYEPKFRQNLSAIEDGYAYPADAPFLSLLSIVLCMAAWYRSKTSDEEGSEEMRLWSSELLKIVESRLVYVMDHHSMAAVQTCILLGSHHVYHGRPNLSFALLGATVKMAQVMGLHRDLANGDPHDIEERKRVWWTIYTWDRFASISYGRPLSISDDDCNVAMPAEFPESPYFVQQSIEQDLPGVVYSPYQTELSKLYLLASPALKPIFGSLLPLSSKQSSGPEYTSLVKGVTQKLMAWHQQLPPHLILDLNQDCRPGNTSTANRAYTLQSLSLQLTFDNLLIVLYRPVLARQVENLTMKASTLNASALDIESQAPSLSPQNTSNRPANDHASPMSETTASSEYWWSAAVRTARVTELPQIAQIATDTHLVAFVAMNLFHAAIVLISLALSDPLSDRSQGVKRTITRVFRLQELLGQRSALSSQSSAVLKKLICLLLQREGEAMLAPVSSAPTEEGLHVQQQHQTQIPAANYGSMSVEDTLRFPLEATLNASGSAFNRQAWPNLSLARRLNESLASVQRVFPTSQDQLLHPGPPLDPGNGGQVQDGAMPLPPHQMWEMPSGQPNSYDEPQAADHEEHVVDHGGNGLFWLWDDTWDGGYMQ